MKYGEEQVFMVTVEYYTNPDTDSKETDTMDLAVLGKSYSEAEEKTVETIGKDHISQIWSINILDAVPVK